jgi:hypothetical protein
VSSMTTLDESPDVLLIAVMFSNIYFKVNTIGRNCISSNQHCYPKYY